MKYPKLGIGERFGMMVIKRVSSINKAGNEVYELECDCGETLELTFASIMNQRRRSCGCDRKNAGKRYFDKLQKQKDGSIKLSQNLAKNWREQCESAHERFANNETWLLNQLERWRKREEIIEALY